MNRGRKLKISEKIREDESLRTKDVWCGMDDGGCGMDDGWCGMDDGWCGMDDGGCLKSDGRRLSYHRPLLVPSSKFATSLTFAYGPSSWTFLIPKTSKNTKSTKTCSYWWQSSWWLLCCKQRLILFWSTSESSLSRYFQRKQLIICNNLPIYFCNLFVFSGFFGIPKISKNSKSTKTCSYWWQSLTCIPKAS